MIFINPFIQGEAKEWTPYNAEMNLTGIKVCSDFISPGITTFVCLLGHDQEPDARKSEKGRKLRGHNDAARDD